jgi:hypothetical protein
MIKGDEHGKDEKSVEHSRRNLAFVIAYVAQERGDCEKMEKCNLFSTGHLFININK